VLNFFDGNFQDDRLTFRDERPLAFRQLGELRQFQPLHDRLNPPQMMTANRYFVCGEDQLEILLVAATIEFRENELVVRQQQRKFGRNFNA
jgi:hypothetical protein